MTGKSGAIRAGRAYVEAFLDASQLDKGLKNAQAKLNGFAKQVGAIGGQLVAMGTAILAPLAAGVKMFTSYGDQIAKMSKRTGIGVEALSALEHAAGLSGSSIESLERSLVAMAKFMHIASTGSKESTDVLEDLSLTLDDLQRLSPEQRFLKLADSLSKIDDPTRRAGLAMKVFGKSGTELIPLLEHGAAGIDELMRHAEELGLVLSQEDAAAAEVMNDAMDDLNKSVRSVFFALGRELLPVAKDLVEWITAQVPAIRDWIAENRELLTTIAKVAGVTVLVGTALLGVAAAAKLGAVAIGTLVAAKNVLIGRAGMLARVLPAAFAIAGILAAAKAIYDMSGAVQELNRNLEKARELDNELLSRQGADQQSVVEQVRLGKLNVDDELSMAEKNLAGMQASLKGQQQLVDELSPTWKSLWQSGRAEWDVEKQNLDAANERLKQQKKHVKELKDLKAQRERDQRTASERTEEEVAGIEKILTGLNEQLETFGLDSAQRAIRELENLNASEEELAEARKLSAEMAAKEAEAKALEEQQREAERAKAEAERATQQIADVLQQLADEVSDLQIKDPTDRAVEQQLRDLRRLGATPDQLKAAADLVRQKEGELAGPEGLGERSFTAQGGTFSSLASLAFGSGEGDALKSIEQHTADTAKHTKKMSRSSGMTFGA